MAILEITEAIVDGIFTCLAFDKIGIKWGILNQDKRINIRGSVKVLSILLLLLIPLLFYRMNVYTGEWFYFLSKILFIVFAFGVFVFVICSIIGFAVSGYHFLKHGKRDG